MPGAAGKAWLKQFFSWAYLSSLPQNALSCWRKCGKMFPSERMVRHGEALAMQKHRPSPSIMKKGSDAYASLCVV